MPTTTIYVRVSQAAADYARQESARSGLPLAKVVEAFLEEAMRCGWKLGGRRIEVTERAGPAVECSTERSRAPDRQPVAPVEGRAWETPATRTV